VFLFATNEISKSKIPLIHQVIPIFDIMTTVLEDTIDKTTLPLAVRHAALRGYFMLNKYYRLSDDAVVYRIAMSMFLIYSSHLLLLTSFTLVLHPRFKTNYFTRAKWPQEWITEAESLVRNIWTTCYKPAPASVNSSTHSNSTHVSPF
jgi:hypothetical protein